MLLDKPSHFTAADDADVLVAAGIYHIERSTGTQLRLVGTPPQTTVEIQATMTTHEEVVASPLALVIAEEGQEDVVHLVLLLPDGQGLDAAGTFSGTRSRGSRVQPINRPQMQQAMSQIQPFSQPPSPSPLLRVSPAATAATATPPAESIDTSNPGNSVTWNYLAMHHPGIVAQALADVQTGKQPRSSVAGLASDVELNDMLKTNWSAEVSAMRDTGMTQAGVTPRGLSLTDKVTAIPQKSPHRISLQPSHHKNLLCQTTRSRPYLSEKRRSHRHTNSLISPCPRATSEAYGRVDPPSHTCSSPPRSMVMLKADST